jgi:hypothetical protein
MCMLLFLYACFGVIFVGDADKIDKKIKNYYVPQ